MVVYVALSFIAPFLFQTYQEGSKCVREVQRLMNVVQINPYMSMPCHIEMILTEGEEVVQKSTQAVKREEVRLNSRQRGSRVRRAITAAAA